MTTIDDHNYLTVGVTGHIDHGKTTLVGKLTGVETDTHPEEKQRGITIDLGFAALQDGERTFAFVDAPGHQKYVGNLLAGVAAVDLGLLVVACDQGIQEQTLEHASILQTLGVPRMIVALSRIDLCDEAKRAEVAEELEVFLSDYGFEEIPIVPLSAHTGEGLDELRAELRQAADARSERPEWIRNTDFRMPIDRVLHVPGRGLVVAGTIWSGSVRLGDHLQILGHNQSLRVRELEVHGTPAEASYCGRRTAINLAGDAPEELRRGDELVAIGQRGTQRLLVELRVYPEAKNLKLPTTVQLHSGTGSTSAKISGPKELSARDRVVVLVETDTEVLAARDQSCLFRLPYPVGSFAGGRVLACISPQMQHNVPKRSRWLELGAQLSATEELSSAAYAWLDLLGEYQPTERWLEQQFAVPGSQLEVLKVELAKLPEVLQLGNEGTYVHRNLIERVANFLERCLKEQASQNENAWLVQAAVEKRASAMASADSVRAAIELLIEEKRIVTLNGMLAATSETTMLSKKQRARMVELLRLFEGNTTPPTLKEVSQELSLGQDAAGSLLRHAAQQGLLINLGDDLHIHCAVFEGLCTALGELFGSHQQLTVPEIKDHWGVTRKHAIPLLEYCDQQGYTTREGDARIAGPRLSEKEMV